MTKAYSKRQRRLARRKKQEAARQAANLPELAPIQKPVQPRHKGRFARAATEAGADIAALEARCRQAGIEIVTVPNAPKKPGDDTNELREARRQARHRRALQMRDTRAPWNGCEAGRAMARLIGDERERGALWDAIQHMRAVWLAYDRAMVAPHRHAQCLRLLAPTEAMQADASTPPSDPRSEAERYRQAKAARETVARWLRGVVVRDAMICISVVIDDARCRDAEALIRALRCVADGMAGREKRNPASMGQVAERLLTSP